MTFCSNCGTKNEDNAKFCASCGKPVGESTSQAGAAPQASAAPTSVSAGQMRKCPACGGTIDAFKTKCVCGYEINTAESDNAVKEFFKKLEDLSQKEYAANKAREGETGKKKKKQPKLVALCEVVAVVSLILIILHATGVRNGILSVVGIGSASTTVLSGNIYLIQSGGMALGFDDTGNRFAMAANDGSQITGTYRISDDSTVILTLPGGNTMRLTIVNDTTLRDEDDDIWRLSQQQ